MNKTSYQNISSRVLLLLVIIGLAIAVNANSATYYVATYGSDSNNGLSEETPFKTVKKAVDTVQPGDKVMVKAGTYFERIQIKTSGLPGSPIEFEGERGPNGEFLTIIDGGEPATSWTVWEEGSDYKIWKTTNLPYYTPGNMVWGDKQIPQHRTDYYNRFSWLRSHLNHEVQLPLLRTTIHTNLGRIECVFGCMKTMLSISASKIKI